MTLIGCESQLAFGTIGVQNKKSLALIGRLHTTQLN